MPTMREIQPDRDQEASLEELVRRYKGSVYRLALSMLGPGFEAEAEDVTQDVFFRVHRERGSFRGESKFSTWLYRIAWNRAFDVRQRARFRMRHCGDAAMARLADPGPGAGEAMDGRARMAALQECIGNLPEVYQTVLRLHYWMDSGIAEIAELLGAPEGTVKSYLYRARKLLGEALEARGFQA